MEWDVLIHAWIGMSRWDILDESILDDGILNENILNEDILNEDILNEDILNGDILNEDILDEGILDKDGLGQKCAKYNVSCSLFKFTYWKSLMMIFIYQNGAWNEWRWYTR